MGPNRIFRSIIRQYFRQHGADVVWSGGDYKFTFDTGEEFPFELRDPSFFRDMAVHGSIAFGESFVDGKWDIDFDLMEPLQRQMMARGMARPLPHHYLYHKARQTLSRAGRTGDAEASRSNSSHHYDRGNDLFASFLDEGMNYSCGFFDDPAWDLATAQRRKVDLTLERLQLFEGASVLDVGCGWGTAAIEASRRGCDVTGINLSTEQVELARARAELAQSKARFELADYRDFARDHEASFDRIVSIGMVEHVGRRQHRVFFDRVRRMLKPGGLAVVHSIVDWPYGVNEPWLERYIFPGSYAPRVEEMVDRANAAGLRTVGGPYRHDGANYAATLGHWRKRFLANYNTLDPAQYPERFKRLWVAYLAGCEAAFGTLGVHNAQVVYQRPVEG
jgi:cyclopropane-fatty-acyl-phospholipid synthase